MDYVKYITYTNIYSGLCSGLYTTLTLLSYIPSLVRMRRKGVSPEDITNTIDKLNNIQTNIKKRIIHIDENIEEFLTKSKLYYTSGNKRSAIYNLKLKKMYEREKEKLESINFNIETQIFSIESMDLIIVTAETLKDTSLHMKSMNTTFDIDKIESTIEELQDHQGINNELQTIFSQSISIDFNDDELLEELEQLNTNNQIPVEPVQPNIDQEYKLLELKQNLPIPPSNINNDDPLDPPSGLTIENNIIENNIIEKLKIELK
tara:strand:+ start:623 stop:1408 length:786 start_codon:yes stop_codon:yes gene_type:complete